MRWSRRVLLWTAAIALTTIGCVDLTPPWQNGGRADSAISSGGEGGNIDLDGLTASGGSTAEGGASADGPWMGLDSSSSGLGGNSDGMPGVVDMSATGEPGIGIDSATIDDTGTSGTGGGVDVPLGGAGGIGAVDAGSDASIVSGGASGSGGRTGSGGSAGKGGSGGSTGKGGSGGTNSSGGAGGSTAAGGSGGSTATGGSTNTDASASLCTSRTDSGVDSSMTTGMLAYYSCNQTSGATLTDSSGNSNDATLATGSGGSTGYSFATGKVGNALDLVAASEGYATLPQGILASACEMTVAAWVYVNQNTIWQRLFDFGNDENVYMFVTPKNGTTNVVRFAITVKGNGEEQIVDGQAELTVGAWSHVAIVLGSAGGILYVNGTQAGANSDMTLRPADLGSTTNNYIGRSQFPLDPYLDGDIDEFKVYSRALSAAEIQTLANGT